MAANRGEIAIRIMRAATELGLRTATIYSNEDRLSLHRFKADEAYEIGSDKGPVAAYLDIDGIIALAKERGIDAIHPGYGFLSENNRFSRACAEAGITFVGPAPELLEALGDKTAARRLARQAGVPTVPGTGLAPDDPRQILRNAESVGYPLIVKALFGGGGRGMRVVNRPDDLLGRLEEARAEALRTFGDGSVFLERYVARARHIEGSDSGRCPRVRGPPVGARLLRATRHQKVVELAPAPNLSDELRDEVCAAAIRGRSDHRLRQRGHCRVYGGCRYGGVVLHRGEPAHPGGAHRHRDDHRHRPGAIPDLGGARLPPARAAPLDSAAARDPAARHRHPVPHHHRGSGE